jgi:hypothetical protein
MDLNPEAYDALIMDWDGTMVDFPVKFFCSGQRTAPGAWERSGTAPV